MSIHVGLNRLSSTHYGGWDGKLDACEFDARDMEKLARSQGFKTTVLKTKSATSTAVTAAITKAADTLKRGDILFLTYSGHGGQVPDTNGDEGDALDETWCLYDREFVDDELYALWRRFEEGVRIVMLSDSCHSGSVARAKRRELLRRIPEVPGKRSGPPGAIKAMPRDIQDRTYRRHKRMYDDIQKSHPQGDHAGVGATVILISGCQDDQESQDGKKNGRFTDRLLRVWNGGPYKGGYKSFKKAIARLMPDEQMPNYMTVGLPNPHFEGQRPFTI
jgi:metacaspase-1